MKLMSTIQRQFERHFHQGAGAGDAGVVDHHVETIVVAANEFTATVSSSAFVTSPG